MAVRAFLSFVEEDLGVVNLFRGQAKNESLDLEFDDYSVKEPFNSRNSVYIQSQISDKIKYASLTICLYGVTTYTSQWVEWELNKSLEMGKPIMGVCLYDDGRVKYHPALLEKWPRHYWNIKTIVKSMNDLTSR